MMSERGDEYARQMARYEATESRPRWVGLGWLSRLFGRSDAPAIPDHIADAGKMLQDAELSAGSNMRQHPASDGTPATAWALNPWQPMQRPLDLKHLGKLAEELGEASSAVARCLIQGIDEREPVTGKPNREWLEDELADVIANFALVAGHFGLDLDRMEAREIRKEEHLKGWHDMVGDAPASAELTTAEHNRRVTELLSANNAEVERSRVVTAERDAALDHVERIRSGMVGTLEQALSCILGETPENWTPEEARQDTIDRIRRALAPEPQHG